MKRVFWFCVDSNGDEKITSNRDGWQRFSPDLYHGICGENVTDLDAFYREHKAEKKKVISWYDTQMKYDHWVEFHEEIDIEAPREGYHPNWNYLPKGSIEKITGKKITWADEPIKIEEEG